MVSRFETENGRRPDCSHLTEESVGLEGRPHMDRKSHFGSKTQNWSLEYYSMRPCWCFLSNCGFEKHLSFFLPLDLLSSSTIDSKTWEFKKVAVGSRSKGGDEAVWVGGLDQTENIFLSSLSSVTNFTLCDITKVRFLHLPMDKRKRFFFSFQRCWLTG